MTHNFACFYVKIAVNRFIEKLYRKAWKLAIYIYGLDRVKRAGAIMLDIKCVCMLEYRSLDLNPINNRP